MLHTPQLLHPARALGVVAVIANLPSPAQPAAAAENALTRPTTPGHPDLPRPLTCTIAGPSRDVPWVLSGGP